uniref:EF-hand domain-containing protein n=1 Tax=Chromera velia CCMP2878 TaxID=1169474 RepID=A0A0G4FTG5_9ALVE|mmetsp:Transcript_27324/g.53635  ORF Transcript_27324/g.53635 Transcript_27324/m.53635 type:complete len:517 (-) Transcript_27324:176-1726(-)|eukprot:Cvel_3724.t1-p1 / transcript=Cvel_3724.t1 / gene=Cvel_3724 / organism=Chromera_velia_CCMP2878 / gene_product=hypothetical protein / transcript_product=hypothetical protein / location=Cvel_scaffold155:1698-6200(+) / protein_length=516 / sequence_SO=supercontig / SO=protein_coding / is_pseudo=false
MSIRLSLRFLLFVSFCLLSGGLRSREEKGSPTSLSLYPVRRPSPSVKAPAAYINFNFPPGSKRSRLDEIIGESRGKAIYVDAELRDLMLLFGRLAEDYYPPTPEQSRKGEPYAMYIQGAPSSIQGRLEMQTEPSRQWHKLFMSDQGVNQEEVGFTTLKNRLKRLPLRWPVYQNETAVLKPLLNEMMEANSVALEIIPRNDAKFHRYVLKMSSGNRGLAPVISTAIIQMEQKGMDPRFIHDFVKNQLIGGELGKFFAKPGGGIMGMIGVPLGSGGGEIEKEKQRQLAEAKEKEEEERRKKLQNDPLGDAQWDAVKKQARKALDDDWVDDVSQPEEGGGEREAKPDTESLNIDELFARELKKRQLSRSTSSSLGSDSSTSPSESSKERGQGSSGGEDDGDESLEGVFQRTEKRQRSKSDARRVTTGQMASQEIDPAVVNVVWMDWFGDGTQAITKEKMGAAIGKWAGPFSDGKVDFESFLRGYVAAKLRQEASAATTTTTTTTTMDTMGGLFRFPRTR